jgi:hypothetical protein
MLADAALVTFIVGMIAGGRPGRLKDLDLRAPSIFIVAAIVQVTGAILGARGSPLAVRVGGPLHIMTYMLLLVGLWLNRHRWEMRVVGVGVLLNCLVIAANGGSMPVDRELAVRAGNMTMVRLLDSPTYVHHEPMTPETRLKPLGDVLLLPRPYPRPHVFSIGDVFVTVGGCWLILSALGAFGLGRSGET